jgi:hypothetical protein
MTDTTELGKYVRMSPSQRVTDGTEPPRPPRRSASYCRPTARSRSNPLADRAPLGLAERGGRPAEQRQDGIERVGRHLVDPAVERPEQVHVVEQQRPRAAQEPLDPARPGGRLRAGRQGQPHPARRLGTRPDALVEQQPRSPTRDQPVDAGLVRDPADRRAPCLAVVRVVEQRDRTVDGVDPRGERVGRLVVE